MVARVSNIGMFYIILFGMKVNKKLCGNNAPNIWTKANALIFKYLDFSKCDL